MRSYVCNISIATRTLFWLSPKLELLSLSEQCDKQYKILAQNRSFIQLLLCLPVSHFRKTQNLTQPIFLIWDYLAEIKRKTQRMRYVMNLELSQITFTIYSSPNTQQISHIRLKYLCCFLVWSFIARLFLIVLTYNSTVLYAWNHNCQQQSQDSVTARITIHRFIKNCIMILK